MRHPFPTNISLIGTFILLCTAVLWSHGAFADSDDENQDRNTECIYARNISGFNTIDDRHVLFTSGVNKKHLVTTFGRCHQLQWAETIAIKTTSSWTCSYSNDNIIYNDGTGPRRCPIADITRVESMDEAREIVASENHDEEPSDEDEDETGS